MFSIYILVNNVNNKIYVGQTVRPLYCRWNQHKLKARRGETSRLCSAIRKYGYWNFKLKTFATCETLNEAYWWEKMLIALFGSNKPHVGYNMTCGGEGALGRIPWNKGKTGVYSAERLKQMSEYKKGRPSPNKGKVMSLAQRQKISETCKARGIKPSKHACSLGGKSVTGEAKRRWGNKYSCKNYAKLGKEQDARS